MIDGAKSEGIQDLLASGFACSHVTRSVCTCTFFRTRHKLNFSRVSSK